MTSAASWAGALKVTLCITAAYAAFSLLWKYFGDTAYATLLLWTSSPFIRVLKGLMLDSTSVSGGNVIAAFTDYRHTIGEFKMGVHALSFTRDVPPTLAVLTASWPFIRRSFSAGGTGNRFFGAVGFYAASLGILFTIDLISSILIIARTVTLREVQISPLSNGLGAVVWIFSGNVTEDFFKTAVPFAAGFYVYLTILARQKRINPTVDTNEHP
jgi:hypothetical protein